LVCSAPNTVIVWKPNDYHGTTLPFVDPSDRGRVTAPIYQCGYGFVTPPRLLTAVQKSFATFGDEERRREAVVNTILDSIKNNNFEEDNDNNQNSTADIHGDGDFIMDYDEHLSGDNDCNYEAIVGGYSEESGNYGDEVGGSSGDYGNYDDSDSEYEDGDRGSDSDYVETD
jgi:hypothetical protein